MKNTVAPEPAQLAKAGPALSTAPLSAFREMEIGHSRRISARVRGLSLLSAQKISNCAAAWVRRAARPTKAAATSKSGARLSKRGERFLNNILDELIASGAPVAELNDATPGITDATFAEFRALTWSKIAGVTLLAVAGAFIFAPLFYIVNTRQKIPHMESIFEIMFIIYFATFVAFLSSLGKELLLLFLKRRRRRKSISRKLNFIVAIALTIIGLAFYGILGFKEIYPNIGSFNIWDIMTITLYGFIVFSVIRIFVKV
jgi:hypothetical protein